MRRKGIDVLLTIFFLSVYQFTLAQPCNYSPADCPSDRQLGDSVSRMVNPVLPQEVHMEILLHDLLTDLMQTQADKKGWELYQYDESDGSGFQNADHSAPLAFHLRPPHSYEISFIFIVNKDSLHAWKDWENDFNNHMMEEMEKMKSSNDFTSVHKIQQSKKINEERFRNASMIRVKFEINPENAIISTILDDLRITGKLNVAHAAVALQAHNDKTDERAIFDLDQMNRGADVALLLFGKWNLNPDSYQYYRPAYTNDKKNIDEVTPKTILSDKVRVIAIHVEGSPHHIDLFLQSLETEKINGAIFQ